MGAGERLEHLAWLGVDAVWLTAFYPSSGRDAGYDVSDHCDVDPALGTLEDFDRLLARAHELGLRILIDIVANHTSSEHPWFRSALRDPAGPHRDYYIWRDPKHDGEPPNKRRPVRSSPEEAQTIASTCRPSAAHRVSLDVLRAVEEDGVDQGPRGADPS